MLSINFLIQTFGEEKRTEKVTRTGGWCINDTNEKDQYEGGHHRTDVQLAAALAELLKGICLPNYPPTYQTYSSTYLHM